MDSHFASFIYLLNNIKYNLLVAFSDYDSAKMCKDTALFLHIFGAN
jgi:hypothetical protein